VFLGVRGEVFARIDLVWVLAGVSAAKEVHEGGAADCPPAVLFDDRGENGVAHFFFGFLGFLVARLTVVGSGGRGLAGGDSGGTGVGATGGITGAGAGLPSNFAFNHLHKRFIVWSRSFS